MRIVDLQGKNKYFALKCAREHETSLGPILYIFLQTCPHCNKLSALSLMKIFIHHHW